MKTKHIGITILAIAAILALALLARRERGQGSTEGQAGNQVVCTDASKSASGSTLSNGNADTSKVSSAEPTPEMLESMTTATAQITRGDGSKLEIRSIDGEFDRLLVSPNEKLTIRLALKNEDAKQPILLEADNGGILNQGMGRILLEPRDKDGILEFEYIIGGNSGKYTVYASQGHRQELLSFRAGTEPPIGQGGPLRVFKPQDI